MINKKKNQQKVTELFIKGIKSNISFGFITQSCFAVPKKYQVKFHTLFYYENSKQTRASTNDNGNLYKKITSKPYYFLINDTSLLSHAPLRFRCNLFRQSMKINHNNS